MPDRDANCLPEGERALPSKKDVQAGLSAAAEFHLASGGRHPDEMADINLVWKYLKQGLITVDPHIVSKILPAIDNLSTRPVLIFGETGTGKEVVARCIHGPPGEQRVLVPVNCAHLEKDRLESELFGSARGAFTGAVNRNGYVKEADGGTLFLDEIGELPQNVQAKFLRFLESGEYRRMGETEVRHSTARLIGATNRPAELREDLRHRFAIHLELPPLRSRTGDLPLLLHHFVTGWNSQAHSPITGLSRLVLLESVYYEWLGNVRELKNKVEEACDIQAGVGGSTILHSLGLLDAIPKYQKQNLVVAGLKAKKIGNQMRPISLGELPRYNLADLLRQLDTNLDPAHQRLWTVEAIAQRHEEERNAEELGLPSQDETDRGGTTPEMRPHAIAPLEESLHITPFRAAVEGFKHAYIHHHFEANGRNKTKTGAVVEADRGTVARYLKPS